VAWSRGEETVHKQGLKAAEGKLAVKVFGEVSGQVRGERQEEPIPGENFEGARLES
jgi:hypothetical protein